MGGPKRKTVERLLNYLAARREMIVYDKCEQRGWDVGTGPMESMCGVTTERIKGRGRRWDIDNATGHDGAGGAGAKWPVGPLLGQGVVPAELTVSRIIGRTQSFAEGYFD